MKFAGLLYQYGSYRLGYNQFIILGGNFLKEQVQLSEILFAVTCVATRVGFEFLVSVLLLINLVTIAMNKKM